jgi:hypothetical protein
MNRHFYIDEAGDLSLFNKKGKMLALGQEGRSRYFMIAVAELSNPEHAKTDFAALRQDLLKDPSLKAVPSMEKTARHFHCKDDCPAVRREVFNLLSTQDYIKQISVAIRDKRVLQQKALSTFILKGKKLSEQDVYQDLSARLLKNQLHKSEHNTIVFAHRGSTTSNKALRSAVTTAQSRFEQKWGVKGHNNHQILCTHPEEHIGLQLTDYCLWAVQRLYERQEDYWFEKIKEKFKLIMDLDDVRNRGYGEWYSKSNHLTVEKIKGRAS